MPEPSDDAQIVTKLDAARRQLATAIELWFYDKDQVSIHTLAFAAYEVIHTISKKKGRTRDLLFDTVTVSDEDKGKFRIFIKKFAHFFKHADRDPTDATIEFFPVISELFILFAVMGLETMRIPANEYESSFAVWLSLTKPYILTKEGHQFLANYIPSDKLPELRQLPKSKFFEIWSPLRRQALGI